MRTREKVLRFGLTFPETYIDAPFHDDNWQLVRVRGSNKAFLWTYEKDGNLCINVKVDPEWRDLWGNPCCSINKKCQSIRENQERTKIDESINIYKTGKICTYR